MPLFEFQCTDCEAVYEELTKYDKSGKYKKVVCPKCGSKKKKQLAHTFGFSFNNPVGTDLYRSSHDYRFKHNLPKVLAEREAAERANIGGQGRTPYGSDSVSDDLNNGDGGFGEIK